MINSVISYGKVGIRGFLKISISLLTLIDKSKTFNFIMYKVRDTNKFWLVVPNLTKLYIIHNFSNCFTVICYLGKSGYNSSMLSPFLSFENCSASPKLNKIKD